MREFTKSAMSFSWAMSIFGAQQVTSLFAPAKAAKAFDAVTGAAKEELGGPFQALFGTADRLQREMVDLAFGVVTPGCCNSHTQNGASSSISQSPQLGGQSGPIPPASTNAPSPSPTSPKTNVVEEPPTSGGWGAMPVAGGAPSSSPTSPRTNVIGQQPTGGGWGAMPVTGSASPISPGEAPAVSSVSQEKISADYAFASHFVEVFGSRMHYIDEGEGDPILLVHGNATWSYVWRNVIPHLTPYGRCIAPDLIGFGLSDKPDIQYQWIDQARYLVEFVRKLGLKKITLVCNDFGISLALLYAMLHEDEVKAIAFFEGVFKTFKSLEEAYTPDFRPLFKQFRSGEAGGEGYKLLVDQNVFIEELLPRAAGRELTEVELGRYREPFQEVRSRVPIWRFARSVPIGGEPRDVWAIMTETTEWFKRTTIPKLLFHATPGGLVTPEFVAWARRNLKNLKVVHVGPGVHYLTETSPHVIGRELVKWLAELGHA